MLDPILVATPHLGAVERAEPVDGFVGNQTFRLHTADGVYYLKSGATIADEARACELVRAAGVPAPEVIALGTNYLITRELAGRPLAEASASVLQAAGRAMRRVHSIAGADAGWRRRLQQVLDDLDVLPAELAVRVREMLPPFVARVQETAPVLLHGDLHLRHLYAVGGELTGILDWGDAAYGDPVFDLARMSMAGPEAMAAFLDGYGVIELPERTLSCYRVLWSLMALQAEHLAGGDWFQAHLDSITRELS
ncbi:aminoglycoside phosphotransferase family protein [Kribbella sp. HUAS MG21]|uniref:Aminoglycoside phosphotransferase family protein n=1 Tax=Kribbella sp. HUAS MG21 TaxID=3160966 RepID=A0AAU7T8Z4_9ACTN